MGEEKKDRPETYANDAALKQAIENRMRKVDEYFKALADKKKIEEQADRLDRIVRKYDETIALTMREQNIESVICNDVTVTKVRDQGYQVPSVHFQRAKVITDAKF